MTEFGMECIVASYERIIKRLWILCIIMFVICAASNLGWIYYNSQFETVESTQEVTQETDGGDNSFVGGDLNGAPND